MTQSKVAALEELKGFGDFLKQCSTGMQSIWSLNMPNDYK